MGEIADMMLDGTLCEGCGGFIDEDGGDGYPRYCSQSCAKDRGMDLEEDRPKSNKKTTRKKCHGN